MLKELQELGLTSKEAKVYTACFEVGTGSAQRIAERAKIPKSTTFDILKSLHAKGLVSITKRKSRNLFLVSELSVFQEKMKRQKEAFEKIYPELFALYNSKHRKPKVRFYEGKEGVRVVMNEILQEATELIGMGTPDQIFQKLDDYFPEFSKRRAQKKIPIKLLLKDTAFARQRKQSGIGELREVRLVQTDLGFDSLCWVWKNKIVFLGVGEDVMIVVLENSDFANMLRGFFGVLWKTLGD